MSRTPTLPIRTVNPGSLRDIRSNSHNERDHNILKHQHPRPAIPLQTTTTTLMLQMIEKRISTLTHGDQKVDQQQKIAGKSNGLVEIRPRLEVDCCVEECTAEKVDECEDGD